MTNKNHQQIKLVLILCLLLILLSACGNAELPGKGKTVRMGQATWDTGWFQAQVYRLLLQELGYSVDTPYTLGNPAFYVIAAQGDIDLWANGWFPLHEYYINFEKVTGKLSVVGAQVESGALQGYLIDKETAEKYNISDLSDFVDPEIAGLFDSDGDGLADLVGCNTGWGCERVINHHIEAFGLGDSVEHVQGDYSTLMQETVEKFQSGEPVFFYTWTPNWTVAELELGIDVVWISVPHSSLPDNETADTSVESLAHCRTSPCDLGFRISSIQVVANNNFLAENPAAKALLEIVTIPLEDIAQQNVKMIQGENLPQDIETHAAAWIENNRDLVDNWLSHAKAASKDIN